MVQTQVPTQVPTRRERQREATYDDIVRASRELLAETGELSLRAIASRIGMTAPALYRYVASHQELVDLVAFEIDKAATETFAAAADRQPDHDPGARLVAATVAFRRWAMANPREFGLVFANPVADTSCVRRELITSDTSGHYLHGLLIDLWEERHFDHPALEDLDPAVAESLLDPLIPIDITRIPEGHRGLLWVFISAWMGLYGVVTLEVFGHMDPRVIQSGAMFVSMMREWLPRLGLADEAERYEALLRSELAGE